MAHRPNQGPVAKSGIATVHAELLWCVGLTVPTSGKIDRHEWEVVVGIIGGTIQCQIFRIAEKKWPK